MQHGSPLVSTMTIIINGSTGLSMRNVSCAEVVGVQFERGAAALTKIIIIGDTKSILMYS